MYDLQRLAKRKRKFRSIISTSAQAKELYRLLNQPITAWRDAAVSMLAAYEAGNVPAIEQQDQSHAAEVALLLLLLRFRRYYDGLESWHRKRWLASVKNAAGVDVDMLLERPVEGALFGQSATQAVTGGLFAQRAVAAGKGLVERTGVLPTVVLPEMTVEGQTGENASRSRPRAPARSISTVIAARVSLTAQQARSIAEQAHAAVIVPILEGVKNGTPVKEVKRRINEGLKRASKRAFRNADNESAQSIKEINEYRIEEAGIEHALWMHTEQPHPRHRHLRFDGKIFRIDDPVWEELNWPNCKCHQLPLFG